MSRTAAILYTTFAAILIMGMVYLAFIREPQETLIQPPTVPAVARVWSPQLVAPEEGFSTYPTDVTLQWSWAEPLAENQLYTVRLWREGDPPADITWTADTQLNISDYLESSVPGRFYWQIAVIQLNEDGSYAGLASGWSPVGQFERIPPTPLPTRTPIPTRVEPTPTTAPYYLEPNPFDSPENDIDSLIDIHTAEDADAKHARLLELLWGEDGFPADKMPVSIEENITDADYAGLENLKQIDRLTIAMDLGIESYPYLFHPMDSNNQLMIYHQGSDGDFILGSDTIQFFLREGYTVMAFAMPLLGKNNHPEVFIPHLGNVRLPGEYHFQLYFVEDLIEHGTVLKLFVEPVVVGLNYAQTLDFDYINMIGISGGGWTTHMAAAVDRRIEHSYPVAGSMPLFQRFDGRAAYTDMLAYVQMLPGIFPDFNELELYILGAYGEGRKQLMVINQFDACCFWGVRYLVWYDVLRERMAQLGAGTFEVFLDDSHKQHIISPAALEVILADLEAQ